jgi:predicted helicase
VAISIFVRKASEEKTLGDVYHSEIYGKRKEKFQSLDESDIQNIKWKKLNYTAPNYFFIPRNTGAESEYKKGFQINELMVEYNSGIQSKRDKICFCFNENELNRIIDDFNKENVATIRDKYALPKDGRDWTIEWAQNDLKNDYHLESALYRPFDIRKTVYTGKSKGFLAYPREKTFRHFVDKKNIGLITVRQQSTFNFQHILATKFMIESGAISLQTKEWGYIFPLYIYAEDGTKSPNFKKELIEEIERIIGKVTPENIIDYIYAVLYSPNYREKYKEFLKIDFPRVPYPKDKESFEKLVAFGTELRLLHLLESPKVGQFITTYPVAGSDTIESLSYKNEKVIINTEQYFGNVPEVAWNFYIGGYQPAQKWLKDRKGRTLTNTDIEHYQKIIVALTETDRIMKEIDGC